MKSLIIGASGFVGYYLAQELIQNQDIVFATKLPNEKIDFSVEKIYDLDITNYEDVRRIILEVKPDAIYHLAAQSSVALSWKNPQLTTDINVNGTINILEAVRNCSIETKILLIGSSEEYGLIDYSKKVSEDVQLNPQNIYAITKFTAEKIGALYAKAYDMNIVMTRSFNHIGPRQLPNFVVADFCSQVAKIEKGIQEPIIRVGNLESYRDFTDVRDIVKGYYLLIKKGINKEVYNVGSGNAVKIKDILNMICSLSSVEITIEIDEKKFRPIDVPKIECNNSKISSLGWKQEIKLEQSITEILDFWRQSL